MSTRCVACDFRVGEEHEERAEARGCPIGGHGLSVEDVVALKGAALWVECRLVHRGQEHLRGRLQDALGLRLPLGAAK